MLSQIPPQILALLQEIGQVGDEVSQPVYVVGGFVRDLLLGRENLDLDIVVEGDAIGFASHIAEKWDGRLHTYREFGTATVTCPDGFKIDFVSARRETYEQPGALPLVKYGTIADDVHRRDFFDQRPRDGDQSRRIWKARRLHERVAGLAGKGHSRSA